LNHGLKHIAGGKPKNRPQLFVESLFQNQKLKTYQRIELVILVSNDCRIANVRWCSLTDVLQGLPMDGMVAISSGPD
jgi:hypothetical protein